MRTCNSSKSKGFGNSGSGFAAFGAAKGSGFGKTFKVNKGDKKAGEKNADNTPNVALLQGDTSRGMIEFPSKTMKLIDSIVL